MRALKVSLYPAERFGGYSLEVGQRMSFSGREGTIKQIEVLGSTVIVKTDEYREKFVFSCPALIAIEDTEE